MSIQISVPEALKFYGQLATEFFMSPIPNNARLGMVLRRLEAQMTKKKIDWHQARQDLLMVEDPEEHDGDLDKVTARLAKYEQQAAEWSQEFKAIPVDSSDVNQKNRRAGLQSNLEKLATRVLQLRKEIQGLSLIRDQRQETELIRRTSYYEAKRKFEELQRVGPTLVALTDALQSAKADKMEALEAQVEQGDDTDDILKQLEGDMEEASAGLQAAQQIEQLTAKVDIDTIIDAKGHDDERSALLDKWLK